jgi:hypothetical protein
MVCSLQPCTNSSTLLVNRDDIACQWESLGTSPIDRPRMKYVGTISITSERTRKSRDSALEIIILANG